MRSRCRIPGATFVAGGQERVNGAEASRRRKKWPLAHQENIKTGWLLPSARVQSKAANMVKLNGIEPTRPFRGCRESASTGASRRAETSPLLPDRSLEAVGLGLGLISSRIAGITPHWAVANTGIVSISFLLMGRC